MPPADKTLRAACDRLHGHIEVAQVSAGVDACRDLEVEPLRSALRELVDADEANASGGQKALERLTAAFDRAKEVLNESR